MQADMGYPVCGIQMRPATNLTFLIHTAHERT